MNSAPSAPRSRSPASSGDVGFGAVFGSIGFSQAAVELARRSCEGVPAAAVMGVLALNPA